MARPKAKQPKLVRLITAASREIAADNPSAALAALNHKTRSIRKRGKILLGGTRRCWEEKLSEQETLHQEYQRFASTGSWDAR